jgi:hypothetical protein
MQVLLRLRQHSAMLDWRKTKHNGRRGARELLEKHHMEDIMDTTLGLPARGLDLNFLASYHGSCARDTS